MVRKQYSFLFVAGILVSAACPSFAGLAHTGSGVVCSDCHTAHYSQQHNFRGGPTDLVKDPTGPFRSLLKASANNLCLACHDGSGVAPDVLTNPTNDYLRQAGGLNEAVGASGYNTWKGHTLGSKEVAPGGTWASADRGLACVARVGRDKLSFNAD